MKTLSITIILAAMAAFTFTSCKKDKEDPTITIEEPAENTEFSGGAIIHVHADFADDRELASYIVEIGDEAGEHVEGFHSDDDGSISGTSYEYSNEITVPDSLSVATFYLHFLVTDAEGKTATEKLKLNFAQ